MKHKHLIFGSGLLMTLLMGLVSCDPIPMLYLHREPEVAVELMRIQLDLDVYWEYDSLYNWRDEWVYGWDKIDENYFGNIGYQSPESYHVRRYFTGEEADAKHRQVSKHDTKGNHLELNYAVGYYDILAFNDIPSPDGVQSIVVDESSLDSVLAYTNTSMVATRYAGSSRVANSSSDSKGNTGNTGNTGSSSSNSATSQVSTKLAYWQPEQLFSGYLEDLLVTDDPEDYDYYDPATNTYYRRVGMLLQPVVYIYLTQVIIHHNDGRIVGVDGNARLSGMAHNVNLNNGVTGPQAITVYYNVRYKSGLYWHDERVDVAGGRLTTFGICNVNPNRVTRGEDLIGVEEKDPNNPLKHYMDVDFTFNNGLDSTFVFDVSEQVLERYRGGVITVEIDMDTIAIPSRGGGSAFDAVVVDYEDGGTHEFEM